ncbi:FAD binding domain-containing protein [Oceanibacterium hippocampi]|uniref:Nicotinate dehydrogenase FAD-subunit n=1 Tax=Oceanibacterium hippocampi TaxID=745714 RepID=A0A1Y5SIX9_9PROT|nr:FAD binding domain-containing protein [Oceanibacterium hippocampi]SLN38685.1 Nicotinate dehydrogenase FAD-subunit [Oceanibacterium hippocampi]
MGAYYRPTGLSEALDILKGEAVAILAGGTDFFPARVACPVDENILDISALAGLDALDEDGAQWRIGAGVTWSRLLGSALPPAFDGLKRAAREVGGIQIQNVATIAGNLCNASPAADGVPPLLALDARVVLASATGEREVALADFITGNRATLRRADELLTAILVPKQGLERASGDFLKLGARKYLVISIVMAAAVLPLDPTGRIAGARVAVGACSAVARRLPALEAALEGQKPAGGLGGLVSGEQLAALTPIDDIRASAGYRQDAALTLVARLLDRMADRAGDQAA